VSTTDPGTSTAPRTTPGAAPGTLTVRSARRSDTAALAELAAATFPLACPPGTEQAGIDHVLATTLSAEGFARFLADPASTVLVLQDEAGTLVAYTVLVAGTPDDPELAAAVTPGRTVTVSKFYVLPGLHGSGAARQLMTAALDATRAGDAQVVCLGVNQQNARAQGFYARSGFEVVGVRHFRTGDQVHEDHVMEMRLG
jgi:diamine N-acetyltransferase